MNDIIVYNLFDYWTIVGTLNQSLRHTPYFHYNAVLNSDWPKRVYEVENTIDALDNIIELSQIENFPKRVATSGEHQIQKDDRFELSLVLQNMAMNLQSLGEPTEDHSQIVQVEDLEQIHDYARIATIAFKYHFSADVFANVIQGSNHIKAYLFVENGVPLGCGTLFIDSQNVAGLHTIGTLPEGRNKGIGKKVTEKLLHEAKSLGCELAVLNASVLGEPIYRKLGFETFGELHTFQIKD